MDIIFSANNRQEVFVLPVVPSGVDVGEPQNNDTFSGALGELNLIGNMGLRSMSISSILPNRQYSFMRPGSTRDGWSYMDFFRRIRSSKVPLRVVMVTTSGGEVLNMPCTIDDFSWSVDKAGDIAYSLSVREYVFAGERI